MTGERDTTRQRRVELEVGASSAYRNALMDARVTQEEAAEYIGKSRTRVKQLCSTRHDAVPSLVDVLMLPADARKRVLQWVEDQIRDPYSDEETNHGRRLDELLRTQAHVVSRLMNAVVSGHFSRETAIEIAPVALALRDVAQDVYDSARKRISREEDRDGKVVDLKREGAA